MKTTGGNSTNRSPAQALRLSAAILALAPALDPVHAVAGTSPSVPLFDDGTMIRVPVEAFGRTLYFLVDTGFTVSAMDSGFESRLGKLVATCQAENPLGTDRTLPIYQAPDLSLAGRPLKLNRISCLDLSMARRISGEPCDGILGMDFFSDRVVAIDFDRGIFSITAGAPETVTNTFVAVPIKHVDRYYTAEVSINQAQSLDLLIDTGDNSSLSLNPEGWQKVFSTNRIGTAMATVAGIDQVAQSQIGRIGKLTVQNLNYTNLHATWIRNPSDPSHLGLGFFRRHQVVFDFAGLKLYLQPGRRFFLPDQEDRSGLHLLRENQATIAYSVDEGSPAFNCGVRAGDIITSINGKEANSLTLNVIRHLLQSDDGDRVTLQIRRENCPLNFEFTLKPAI